MLSQTRKLRSVFIVPALLSFLTLINSAVVTNQPPVAVDDSLQVHGFTRFTDQALLANDGDPDGDSVYFDRVISYPLHGNLYIPYGWAPQGYTPNAGYTGPDSFTYRVNDSHGTYSNVATVTIDVRNGAPTPGADSFTIHGFTPFGTPNTLLLNDSDPDGDDISFDRVLTYPTHGNLYIPYGNTPQGYTPNNGYTGADSFTYRICDSLSICAGTTVTLDVGNNAPTPGDDSFPIHGFTKFKQEDLLANDSDPDGDAISFDRILTYPQHGDLYIPSGIPPQGYTPKRGYTGPDSFTYRICDNLGLCGSATVTFDVRNNPPTGGPDWFPIHGFTKFGESDLLANDDDSDGDPISFDRILTYPTHGNLYIPFGIPPQGYTPSAGFAGTDNFSYRICDNLGLCADTTVFLFVPGDGENSGVTSCNARIGRPVNVTSGNMYLQQGDYELPSAGYGISLARTYNSDSQIAGLFGRGWSSQYDESIVSYDSSLVRFNQTDGRAVYFGKVAGAFNELAGDLHAQLSQGGGFSLTLRDGSVEQFNSSGKLVSLADRAGNTTSLTYATNGHLSSVTDPFGRVLTVTTNTNGQATGISDSLGTVATYTYGGSKELLSVTYADNSAFNFTYDGNLRLTSVTDALGNIVELHAYDSMGRAITSEVQNGVDHHSLNYVSSTETDVTDGLGRLTKYTFDKRKGRNVVTRVEGLCGCGGGNNSQVLSWTYDNQLNLTSRTDALNHVTTFTYDANGNRLTQTDPSGTLTYTYNGFAEVLTRADQMSNLTTNAYDGQGNLLTTTDALNNPTTFTYNSRGQTITSKDARGRVTTFIYDTSGQLTERRNANSISTLFFYDARNRLAEVRDGLDRSTLYAYDLYGRINKVTYDDLSFVSLTYDLAGRRTRVTDERNNATDYAYDASYRLASVTDALNHTTVYGYDSMSNLTSVMDALSRTTNYDYDDFNQLVKITYPMATTGAARLVETLGYDHGGNVTSRTDTANRTTTYGYDNVNRLTGTTDAANKTTAFSYDALGRMTSLTDAMNQQYQFGYDALGRQTSITRAGVTMNYIYDAVGNRTQRTDYNGVVTNYAYDDLNRLTTVGYPTRTVTYAYDSLTNLTRATNENGSVNISYDNRYRVSSFSDSFSYDISYNYDTVGNRTSLRVNGAAYATYTYDAANRLTTLKDATNLAFNYGYDAANRLLTRGAPNGVTSSYGYDDLNRLTSLMHTSGATTLSGNLYTYNDANNVASWTTPTTQKTYTYDAVDRLTNVTNFQAPSESYSYDAVGNRTASHRSASYGHQPFNRLTSTASATYSYDNNGNLVSKTDSIGTWGFNYDEENRLIHVTIPNGLTVNYKYDGLGRRIQRTTSAGGNERYVYDRDDVLIDLNADGSIATNYLNDLGLDNHLRQTSATIGDSYFLGDHLGSSATLTDASGNIVEQITSDSFGNGAVSSRTRYDFTGRERDPDTGMLYYRARFYDREVGRFASEDPIGLKGGFNLYEYGFDNPLRFIDPTGLQWQQAALAGGGTLTGVAGTGALGAAAAAAAPVAAVVVVGGVAIYGAWQLGEAIAEAPWNPFTHPRDLPQPRSAPTCNSQPRVIPLPVPAPTKKCPPCPNPRPPEIHRVPPGRPHFPCPGDHWHYFVYNQNPVTCQCSSQRKFGGCCGTPGAPC